jgi:hypothetical protein
VVVVVHVGPAAGVVGPGVDHPCLTWGHYGLGCRTRHQCFLMRLADFGR